MRASTLWNQANGSVFRSSQEEMKLRSTAAVFPPLSLAKKVQLLRLCTRAHNRDWTAHITELRGRNSRHYAGSVLFRAASASAC